MNSVLYILKMKDKKQDLMLRRSLIIVMLGASVTVSAANINTAPSEETPKPKDWPEKLHALLVMNDTDANILQVNNLWYDWKKGLNIQLIQYQQGKLLHAISWNNGTSFYYTLEGEIECIVHEFGVGLLRPDWLDGANYLGQSYIDGFLCNVWEKVEFAWYYEDVVTKRPIHWNFYNGIFVNVMTFEEVDVMVEESQWQAPDYCFKEKLRNTSDLMALGLPQDVLRPATPVS